MDGYEWDENKNRINRRKHGISFEQAAEVFEDEHQLTVEDETAQDEMRYQTIGLVASAGKLAVVVSTIRFGNDGKEVIRIISARRPERHEREAYER